MALSNRVPDMREPERPQQQPPSRPVGGLIWALIALVVLVAIIVWVFKAPSRSTQPNGPNAMQNQVKFSNLKVSPGQNGVSVLQGTAENLTSQPLSMIQVDAGFTDNNGKVVKTVPETVQNAAGSSLQSDPIAAGASHDIAIQLKDAPQNWDGTTPTLTVSAVDHAGGRPNNTSVPGEGTQTQDNGTGASGNTTPQGNSNSGTQPQQQPSSNPR